VLDVACGGGRHGRLFLDRGHPVVMIDRDIGAVRASTADDRAEILQFDLEAGESWPFPGRRFAAVVVVNYLYRPLLPVLVESLEAKGVLLYDTFARGNERYNRPRNPDHLLSAGELLEVVRGRLTVVAYEHGIAEDAACAGVKQRICAIKAVPSPGRTDGEPEPCPLRPPR
jgi:SAM-dependent methyltransferase